MQDNLRSCDASELAILHFQRMLWGWPPQNAVLTWYLRSLQKLLFVSSRSLRAKLQAPRSGGQDQFSCFDRHNFTSGPEKCLFEKKKCSLREMHFRSGRAATRAGLAIPRPESVSAKPRTPNRRGAPGRRPSCGRLTPGRERRVARDRQQLVVLFQECLSSSKLCWRAC